MTIHRPAECWCGGTHGSVAKPAWDLFDAAVMGSAWWAGAIVAVVVLLTAVLAALGLRKAAGTKRVCRACGVVHTREYKSARRVAA